MLNEPKEPKKVEQQDTAIGSADHTIDLVSPDEGNSSDEDDEDEAPIRKRLKSANKAAAKRTTEVSKQPAAAKAKKKRGTVSGKAAAELLASTAESGQVSPESPTKPAASTPVKEASQAALEQAAPSAAMQPGLAAHLPAEPAVPPTDQVTTKEGAANDHSLANKVADAAAPKLDTAQAADEHAQAADMESMPDTTAAGQVSTTEAEKKHSEATKLLAVSGPVTTEHAAAQSGKVTTEHGAEQLFDEDLADELKQQQLTDRRAAAKIAAAEAKVKAAEEAKVKAAEEAAEEAKAKARAAEEAAAEAKAKVNELHAMVQDLSRNFDIAALETRTRKQALDDAQKLIDDHSVALGVAQDNVRSTAATAEASRRNHNESVGAYTAAIETKELFAAQLASHSASARNNPANLSRELNECEAELDAAADEDADLLQQQIAILKKRLDKANKLQSLLESNNADVQAKSDLADAALARADQDEAAVNLAREHERKLAREHASLQAPVDEASTNLKAALAAETGLLSQLNDARLAVKAALAAETALTSELNDARVVFDTKVAELSALNDASKVAELSSAPQSSESSKSYAPAVVAVGTGSPAPNTPTPKTPMLDDPEEDAADYGQEEQAAVPQSHTPQEPSFASPLLNAIVMHDNTDAIADFCKQVRDMRPTREEFAAALYELLGPDARAALDEALNDTAGAGRPTARGGRSRVFFCNGVNHIYGIDETFVVRVQNAELELDEVIALKEHLSAVFDVLRQSADFLPLVMPAKTQGKFVLVIFSRDSGRNAFDAVNAEQLPEFILHVRAMLAECKRTNLVLSDLTFKNICLMLFKVTYIDLDESAFNRYLGAEQSFLAAFSMLFTSRAALFDDVFEALLMSEISQRLRAPAQALDATGSTVHGPLAAPLANSIGGLNRGFRHALTEAVDDHTLRKFIQRSVFFLFTHISNFINTSGYPFSRSGFFGFPHAPSQKENPVCPGASRKSAR
jgi:hypothetical protein